MNKTILCLFDCEEARESLALRLGRDWNMVSTSSIPDALKLLTSCEPDLVVVQLHMQEENCFEFFKVARDIVMEREIPMVAVSAKESCDESIESYLKRCCQYFGCRQYVSNDDFRSNAFVHQLSRYVQGADTPALTVSTEQLNRVLR